MTPAAPPPSQTKTFNCYICKEASTEISRRHQALTDLDSHDEDELLLSELGEQRPLADLYRTRAARADH